MAVLRVSILTGWTIVEVTATVPFIVLYVGGCICALKKKTNERNEKV